MGCYLTVTGMHRLVGPPLGTVKVGLVSHRGVLLIGGLFVMVSAVHAQRQAKSENVDGRYPTFADKECIDLTT